MEFDDDEELIKICSEKAVVLNDILNKKTLNYDEFFGFLMSTTNYERQIIAEEYKQKFSKTVFEEINAKI